MPPEEGSNWYLEGESGRELLCWGRPTMFDELMIRVLILAAVVVLVFASITFACCTQETAEVVVLPEESGTQTSETVEAEQQTAETRTARKTPENEREDYITPCEAVPETESDVGEWDPDEPVPEIPEGDAILIAKTIGVEAPYCSRMEQAAVAWTILNRVDDPRFPDTVAAVVTAPYQFAYFSSTPVREDLYELALDVLSRWARESAGENDVGRVLPPEYLYYTGDGYHNYFRVREKQGAPWDWSAPDPYA